MLGTFQLLGQEYTAINGGPQFPFSEAVTFDVRCDGQDARGGATGRRGWAARLARARDGAGTSHGKLSLPTGYSPREVTVYQGTCNCSGAWRA